MKVFISWSGDYSRQVAELFKGWLKCVLQASDPWVSSEDIQNGSWWFNEIGDQLSSTTVGIVCLTQSNKNKPWILFETGALTKGLSNSRVCPFLIDLSAEDLTPPLSHLNVTLANRNGVFSLVRTINNSLKENGLSLDILTTVFNTYWPQFDSQFNAIKSRQPVATEDKPRDTNDILSEVLSTVRSLDRRLREVENDSTSIPSFRNVSHAHNTTYSDVKSTKLKITEYLIDAKSKGIEKLTAITYARIEFSESYLNFILASAGEIFGPY